MNLPMQKKILRQQLKKIRASLPPWYQQRASRCVQSLIMDLPAYQNAQHIALYRGTQQEMCLDDLWLDATHQHKMCYFPKLNLDKSLTLIPAGANDPFQPNSMGILEPTEAKPIHDHPAIELFIVPLVAFDDQGHRLGMGLGCYDRTLAAFPNAWVIGVAYAFQQLTHVPCDSHDVKVDLIITEQGIIHPRSGDPS